MKKEFDKDIKICDGYCSIPIYNEITYKWTQKDTDMINDITVYETSDVEFFDYLFEYIADNINNDNILNGNELIDCIDNELLELFKTTILSNNTVIPCLHNNIDTCTDMELLDIFMDYVSYDLGIFIYDACNEILTVNAYKIERIG